MKKEEEIYEARFQKHIDELKWLYMELYTFRSILMNCALL